jgi:hypothetical protein
MFGKRYSGSVERIAGNTEVNGQMAADPILYCLEEVTDYAQFERMCHDLMALEGYPNIEPLGGFKDKGRDAVHFSPVGNVAAVFAYSVREDWRTKLDEDAEKIKRHGHPCTRLVFLCTAYFGASERDEAVNHIRITYGWELELFGLERLRILLAVKHSRVLALHPQLFPPPFFPQAGGLALSEHRDHLVLDYHPHDEAVATWLTRKLRLAGYLVWCRALAPIGGSSLNETIESLIKARAFRYLAVLSPDSLMEPDITARRVLASATSNQIVLPLLVAEIDEVRLDARTRSIEKIRFEKSWAIGLAQLFDLLAAINCPRSPTDAGAVLRSFVPPNIVVNEPEQVISNRFQVLHLRVGEMPVLRGTFWQKDERTGYLFGAGFKPRLGTYDGWETPVPLRIDLQFGEASMETVAKDILGLTKLNYNACKLGESEPVTVGFSDAVGEILVSNPTVTDRRSNFKFYI